MDWIQPPEKPTRKAASQHWSGMLLGGLAGAGLGFLGVDFIGRWSASMEPGWRWLIVLYLPFAWLIAVGFHELGHLIGGWLIGGRFLLWVVGPIKVQRTPKGIRWGWNRSVNMGGGMGACLPHDCSRMTAGQLVVMILGGPVASLALSVGIVFALQWMGPVSGSVNLAWIAFAKITAALSLLLAVLTFLPFTAGGFKSDGRRAWDLSRRGPETDQELAMMVLTMQLLSGTRPRELDPVLLERSLSLNDGSLFDLYARMNAYHHAADRQDWAAARGYLETLAAAEAKMVPLLGATVRCEYAWLVATVGTDPELARAWLDSAGPMDFDPATRLRAESAVLLAEGSREAAHAKAQEGLKALETRTMSPVRSPFAAESLERLRDLSSTPA